MEFGECDGHLIFDGEIISRKTIEMSMDRKNAETYSIQLDGENVGGVILRIDIVSGHPYHKSAIHICNRAMVDRVNQIICCIKHEKVVHGRL